MAESSCAHRNGPLPPPLGGIAVSFGMLVDLLQRRDDVAVEVVDFNNIRSREGNSLRGLLSLLRTVIPRARNADVLTAYFASTALPSLGLLLLMISRVLRKPLVLRKAAGFDYFDLGRFRGRIAHYVVGNADLYLAETKHLVRLAHDRGILHARWYPTSRPMDNTSSEPSPDSGGCRRFVFVGQVREHKGIHEIIQAAERFDEGISVDVYGPLFDDLGQNPFQGLNRVAYCGILSPANVIPTLKRYDMQILPTKADSEGYPGAVFEGYSASLPIITTRCGSIPEIVDATSGLLIEAGDSNALFAAMQSVVADDELYGQLQRGVSEKRKSFDAVMWADRFVEYCREASEAHAQKWLSR